MFFIKKIRINYCQLWKALVLHDKKNIEKYTTLLGVGEFAGLFSVMLTLKLPSSFVFSFFFFVDFFYLFFFVD